MWLGGKGKKQAPLTFFSEVHIKPHAHGGHHAVAGPDVGGGDDEDVDLQAALEQRHHGPLVAVVAVLAEGPGADQPVDEVGEAGDEAEAVGAGVAGPAAVGAAGDLEGAELGQEPGEGGGGGGGQDQARGPAQGGAGDGGEGLVLLALAAEARGLEGAHVAGDEGEDGDADAALHQDAEVGPLEEPRRDAVAVGRVEETAVERAREMGHDDEDGGEAAEALRGGGGGVSLEGFERGGDVDEGGEEEEGSSHRPISRFPPSRWPSWHLDIRSWQPTTSPDSAWSSTDDLKLFLRTRIRAADAYAGGVLDLRTRTGAN